MGGFLTGMIAILAGACDDTGYPRVCWRGVTRPADMSHSWTPWLIPGSSSSFSSLAHNSHHTIPSSSHHTHHSHPWLIIIITGSSSSFSSQAHHHHSHPWLIIIILIPGSSSSSSFSSLAQHHQSHPWLITSCSSSSYSTMIITGWADHLIIYYRLD